MSRKDQFSNKYPSITTPHRTITICELESRSRHEWIVSITSGSFHQISTLKDPFNSIQENELLWALEDHAAQSPFHRHRAQAASNEIRKYAANLVDQLQLHEVMVSAAENGDRATSTWRIDIEARAEQSRFQGLHWEILELSEIWSSTMRPRIMVTRKVSSAELTHGPIIPIRSSVFRILLVVTYSMDSTTGGHGGKKANPRLISRPLVEIINKLDSDGEVPVHLEILRPGTWEALKVHLEARGPGFFHLVHFDVLTRCDNRKEQAEIAFISDKSMQKRSWRTAVDVAALLKMYSIKFVVLNAPRSSYSSGVCRVNMAQQMVSGGIRAIIAMPYKVSNTGLRIFMTAFYQCFLSKTWDLALSLSEARNAMMVENLREARFGIKVQVDDWIAPMLYHDGGTEVSVACDGIDDDRLVTSGKGGRLFTLFGDLLQTPKGQPELDGRPGIAFEDRVRREILGRERDMFNIETQLSMESNILLLFGSPGAGKSALISHLCLWWKTTGHIRDHFYFCFYQKPHLSVEMMCRRIYLSLFPLNKCEKRQSIYQSRSLHRRALSSPARKLIPWTLAKQAESSSLISYSEVFPLGWMDQTIEKLRETPHLIVLDSLEWSEASIKDKKELKAEFGEFLKRLEGGRTMVIVVSNQQETWLNDFMVKFGQYKLKTIEMTQAVELAESILNRYNGDENRFQGTENRNYLEKVLSLMDTNPFVIELTLPSLAKSERVPRDLLVEMFQGSGPMLFEITEAAYESKTLEMVTNMLQQLDQESKTLLLCLAPFLTVLPKDINAYFICLLHHQAILPASESDRQSVVSFFKEQIPKGKSDEESYQKAERLLTRIGFLARYEFIIRELLALKLLIEGPAGGTDDDIEKWKKYYSVHPMLTFFLRQTVAGGVPEPGSINSAALNRAFLEFYVQRSLTWDDCSEAESSFEMAARELKWEENNFLSSITIPLRVENSDKCFSMFPTMIFVRLAAMSLVDRKSSLVASLIIHFCETLLKKFGGLSGRADGWKLNASPVTIALFAANWLAAYHAERSGPAAFKKAAEKSLQLIGLAEKTSPRCKSGLAVLEQQVCKQIAWVARDGMVERLQIRAPFSGLISPELEKSTNSQRRSVGSIMGRTWMRLATNLVRMRSIAVQAQSLPLLKLNIRDQLRKDMVLLWKDSTNALKSTILEPFTQPYGWVGALLVETTSTSETAVEMPAACFIVYPEFVRSQLMIQLRDHESAKKILLSGLDRSRQKGSLDGETLCHLRLCELAYANRRFSECIAHVEYLHDIQASLPAADLSQEDHMAYADITLRKALCHRKLGQWDQAIEDLEVAGEIARFCSQGALVYVVLRELAKIKRCTGKGGKTVAELLLPAIGMVYDEHQMKDWAVVDEQGALLRWLIIAVQTGKACEERESVVVRIAEKINGDIDEVRLFLEDVAALERNILRSGTTQLLKAMQKSKAEVERDVAGLWKDVEMVMFGGEREKRRALMRWKGTKWERGLLETNENG